MIYVKKHKVIFIHLIKTGGESVLKAFDCRQKRHCPVSSVLDKEAFSEYGGQLNLLEGSSNFNPSKYIGNLKQNWNNLRISFVRNPWARAVSEYHYNLEKGVERGSFTDMVNRLITSRNNVWKWSQVRWLSHKGKLYADRIYKLESDIEKFQTDFDVKMPHKNKSSHKPYREYYNNRTREIIAMVYRDDIKEFGYEF